MKFIAELSAPSNISTAVKETAMYEIYSGFFGRRLRALRVLNADTVRSLRREKIINLEVFSWDIDGELDLTVLRSMPELESIYLHIEKPFNWTQLQHLTQIQKLTLIARGYKPQPLDFTKFSRLHTVRLTWDEGWNSVLFCGSVLGLTIENSKKIEEFDLRELPNLKELCLTECMGLRKIICKRSQSLESLGISSCRSFECVDPFQVLQTLKYVVLGGNLKFNIEALGNCRDLKRLSMNGVGAVQSLKFLANCRHLERLAMHFSTRVEDGDLQPLIDLPKLRQVSFKRYKNYTHTLEEIERHHHIPKKRGMLSGAWTIEPGV